MNLLHDTGYGFIELSLDAYGYMRGNLNLPKSAIIYQISIRTIDKSRKLDIYDNYIKATNIQCILKLNEALDRLIRVAPKGVLLITLEDNGKCLKKLDKKWLRFKNHAICKSYALTETEWLNFIEEWYSNAI